MSLHRFSAILLALCLFGAFAWPAHACPERAAQASADASHAQHKHPHQTKPCCAAQCCGLIAISKADASASLFVSEAFVAGSAKPKAVLRRPVSPPPRLM